MENILFKVTLTILIFIKYLSGNNDEETTNNIVQNELTFPKDILVSKSCKVLIENLLEKNPKERIDLYNSYFHDWISEE